MSEEQKKNLRRKMLDVYTRIDHIPKNGYNKKQGYYFVRAADMLHAIRKAFADLGVYAETNYELLGTYDIKTNSGGVMHAATVRATIVLHDADSDEVMTVSGLGDGADGGDKGIFKAQTGATKNALRNATLMPDEADPEADEQVDQNVVPQEEPMPEYTDFRGTEAVRDGKHAEPAQPSRPRSERPIQAPVPESEAPSAPVSPSGRPSTAPSTETPASSGAPVADAQLFTEIAPAAGREPGDDSLDVIPTEEQLSTYRSRFSKLGDDLTSKGKLRSSKGLPAGRKILAFLLSVTGAASAQQLTVAQWETFFRRVDATATLENGWVYLAAKVNEANGIQ